MSIEKFSYNSTQIHSNNKHTHKKIVNIENGNGIKRVEEYDSTGKLLHKIEKPLAKTQIAKIKQNIFIPALFKDCCRSNNMRSKTRRNNRRRN